MNPTDLPEFKPLIANAAKPLTHEDMVKMVQVDPPTRKAIMEHWYQSWKALHDLSL